MSRLSMRWRNGTVIFRLFLDYLAWDEEVKSFDTKEKPDH